MDKEIVKRRIDIMKSEVTNLENSINSEDSGNHMFSILRSTIMIEDDIKAIRKEIKKCKF